MKSDFLVTAIISTYNSRKFIEDRINNLLEQTLGSRLEIVIVNSGSTEDEDSLIKPFLNLHKNIKYFRTENRETIYAAWNRAINHSEGKFITNANTDDRLSKNALEILMRSLLENTDCAMVYADQYTCDYPNLNFDDVQFKFPRTIRLKYSRMRQLWKYIPGPQSMWRASLHFQDNFWFDEQFEVSGDNDFVCRIAEKYRIKKVNGVLGYYYKAKDLSNKEFKNHPATNRESFSVRDKYTRRFIESFTPFHKLIFIIKFQTIKFIPVAVFSFYRILLDRFFPEHQIPSRLFFFWFAAVFYELQNKPALALKICNYYEEQKDQTIIQEQITRLKHKLGLND